MKTGTRDNVDGILTWGANTCFAIGSFCALLLLIFQRHYVLSPTWSFVLVISGLFVGSRILEIISNNYLSKVDYLWIVAPFLPAILWLWLGGAPRGAFLFLGGATAMMLARWWMRDTYFFSLRKLTLGEFQEEKKRAIELERERAEGAEAMQRSIYNEYSRRHALCYAKFPHLAEMNLADLEARLAFLRASKSRFGGTRHDREIEAGEFLLL